MSYIGKAPGFGIRNRYYYTATASQTTFSGADDNGQTLAYADSKYLDVYLNGVLLVAGTDYTATTLTSVTLTSGAAASDIVEIVAYDIFSVADTVSAANGGTFNGNITIDGDLSVDGGTIKLDGNYPVGNNNVALGDGALDSVQSGGDENTAIGSNALTANTTGDQNTGIGRVALSSNTTGGDNTAVGTGALRDNTTASNNTAVGSDALKVNTTGNNLTAVGFQALDANTTGTNCTAVGYKALSAQTTAANNAAFGREAGEDLTTGGFNTLIGDNAGENLTTPDSNTFVGRSAGSTVTTGAKNTILGRYNGNQGGLDIRTLSNKVVVSDGDGLIGFHNDAAEWTSNAFGNIDITNDSLTANVLSIADEVATAIFSGGNSFSGAFIINDINRTGQTAFVVVGGNAINILQTGSAFVNSASPSSGEVGIYISSSIIYVKPNTASGQSTNFRIMAFRTRKTQ